VSAPERILAGITPAFRSSDGLFKRIALLQNDPAPSQQLSEASAIESLEERALSRVSAVLL
jgi:hypothetical protein